MLNLGNPAVPRSQLAVDCKPAGQSSVGVSGAFGAMMGLRGKSFVQLGVTPNGGRHGLFWVSLAGLGGWETKRCST